MPRGNAPQTKVHYQGKEDDYIVFIESLTDLEKWKTDSSVPLAQILAGFKIFITHKQGAQGLLDAASKAQLENEFGTSNEDECIKVILHKGQVQETENTERSSSKNDSKGGMISH